MIRRLLWIGVGDGAEADRWRDRLGSEIDRRFGTRSIVGPELPTALAWLDSGTGQARADALLDALIDQFDEGTSDDWLLGVTGLDLAAPGRPYVFGEATVGGCCALVSVARLADQPARLAERVFITLVHELMHVAGLDHCSNSRCVMWPSTSVEDTDRKGNSLCDSCEVELVRIRSSSPATNPA